MKFPSIRFSVDPAPVIWMPLPRLPEIKFPAPDAPPPMTLLEAAPSLVEAIRTPSAPFGAMANSPTSDGPMMPI